jgi:hypothetical protein
MGERPVTTQTQKSEELDSNSRSQFSSEQTRFVLKPRGHCDRLETTVLIKIAFHGKKRVCIDVVQEQSAKENICTLESGSDRGMEKIARGASEVVLFTKYY